MVPGGDVLSGEGASRRAVILVGHGGVPSDCPRELVARLKLLEGRRRGAGRGGGAGGPAEVAAPSEEERSLDARIRGWPRTAETDPYREGLLALAAALRPMLGGAALHVAYNEFCAPTIEEAVEEAVLGGAEAITLVPSMLTPGGVHSEVEIPEAVAHLRARFPKVSIEYAWPFDMQAVARMLAVHLGLPG